MQEKNTNQNQSNQRDSWSMLQAQLGLFSSPVEHEKVSVVNAVDQRKDVSQDDAPENGEMVAEESNTGVPPTSHESEPVPVNILLPTILDNESDAWDASSHSPEDDIFGFNDLGDCDIPKNAFAPPKKTKAPRGAKTVAQVPQDVLAQMSSDQTASAQANESLESETPVDPLLSDELPTSLWQPRKSAAVAKKPPAKPSFAETRTNASVDTIQERKSDSRKQDDEQPPVDDLAKHSFGIKRRERSQSRYEKTDDRKPDDRRSRESSFRSPDREWREDAHRPVGNPKHQQRKEAAPQVPFDDRARESNATDSSFDELVWEPKIPKEKGRKSDKSSWQKDDTPVATDDRNEPEGFGYKQVRNHHDAENDWLDVGTETEQAPPRDSRRNRKQKPSAELKRNESKPDVRNAFDAEKTPQRHAREDRESSSRRPPVQKPAKTSASGTTTQKIAVCSWDDAVRDIIEKNMQRRPAPKNDRPSGSRRGPRR